MGSFYYSAPSDNRPFLYMLTALVLLIFFIMIMSASTLVKSIVAAAIIAYVAVRIPQRRPSLATSIAAGAGSAALFLFVPGLAEIALATTAAGMVLYILYKVYTHLTEDDSPTEQAIQRLIDVLSRNPQGMTFDELLHATALPVNTLQDVLDKLIQRGIVNIINGIYVLDIYQKQSYTKVYQ